MLLLLLRVRESWRLLGNRTDQPSTFLQFGSAPAVILGGRMAPLWRTATAVLGLLDKSISLLAGRRRRPASAGRLDLKC
jgi:hypothetical protein